jgi:hypothetical protein
VNPSPLRPLAGGWGLSGGGISVPVTAARLAVTCEPRKGPGELHDILPHLFTTY